MKKETKKLKEVQRASFRFEKALYNDFRALCKEEGFSQVKLLEKLMRQVLKEHHEKK